MKKLCCWWSYMVYLIKLMRSIIHFMILWGIWLWHVIKLSLDYTMRWFWSYLRIWRIKYRNSSLALWKWDIWTDLLCGILNLTLTLSSLISLRGHKRLRVLRPELVIILNNLRPIWRFQTTIHLSSQRGVYFLL